MAGKDLICNFKQLFDSITPFAYLVIPVCNKLPQCTVSIIFVLKLFASVRTFKASDPNVTCDLDFVPTIPSCSVTYKGGPL